MPLSAGTRLGSYEILSALGAGGMGEVYRARDTRLDRDVAIKILPEAFAADAERVARFQREAKVLASLNHSHIAAIYGLEDADGVKALVMELVEGEDLAQRLARGAIPFDEALPIAKQIAEALEAAHEQGIIHRDLKPSNIKLRPDGAVKVLDFGIAKAIEVGSRSGDVSGSPTVTSSAMTRLGMVLGTPAYMSPEQARGHQAETRTDVWAFGCVLYEMLTGMQAFGALTPTDTIAAVIKGDPDWTLLPPALPQGMARVLRRCLAKDPRQRFRDIADVRLDIADALAESPLESAGEATSTRTEWRYLAAAAIAGCLVGAVAVALVDPFTTRQASPVGRTPGVVRLTLPLAERERLVASRDLPLGLGRPAVAISPDGTRVAYVAVREGVARLYLRTLDEPEARSIPGTEGALSPFFSPDGHWLGFLADVKLKKVSLLGGDPVVLCDARNALGASWGDDDGIVFADGEASRLVRVPAGGGPVQLVTHALGGGVRAYAWPDLLPGGKSVLVTEDAGAFGTEALRVNWVSLETGESRALVSGSSARYLPPGYIVFLRSGTLMAASFDTSRVLVGDPIPVINHISRDDAAAQFAVSRDGSLVYATGTESATGALTWVDRRGSATPVGAPVRAYGTFRISPDGRRLALQTMGATADIWTYDFERRHLTRLTTSANNGFPIWTADGKFVTYGSDRTGRPTLFKQLADGSREAERLVSHDQGQIPYDWSSDGRVLVFGETGRDTAFDIWLLPADGDRTPRPFIQTTFMEWGLRFSPDGQWAAYTSDASGRYEVYVRPYPGPGERYQISSEGGEEPVWHPGGHELFYRNGQKWMAVAVAALSSFQAQTPQLAFEGPYLNVAGASYDIARDGSRFLVIKGNDRPPITSLQVVLNWHEELKQRVPIR